MKLMALFWIFFRLGLVSFGSVFAVLPELQRALVDQGFVTPEGFLQAFVLGQVVPGPNMAMCAVIGWHVAGLAGALVAFVGIYSGPVAIMGAAYAMFLPFIGIAMVVMYLMGRLRAPRLSTPPAAVAKFPVAVRTPHNVQAVEDARADELKRAA